MSEEEKKYDTFLQFLEYWVHFVYTMIPNKAAEREFLRKTSEKQYAAVQYAKI
jgi:hypothetical protein